MNKKPNNFEEFLLATMKTADHELTCEEAGDIVHRYVESVLAKPGDITEELKLVSQHLGICPQCKEVVDAIIASVQAERELQNHPNQK